MRILPWTRRVHGRGFGKIYEIRIRRCTGTMDKKVHYITEPEEVLSWMKEHEDFKKMNSDDAQILLNYFEGHDYRLGTDKEGNLYRVDVNAEDEEIVPYDMDEVIDLVCEWNYELIECTVDELKDMPEGPEKNQLEIKIASLKEDEERLDALFDQTKYSGEIEVLAQSIATSMLERMGIVGIDAAIKELGNAVREVQVGGGR